MGGCGLFASGLYNCIASACIGGVWGMTGTLLRCAGGLSHWRHSVTQLRRSVMELRGLDGTIFGFITVLQRFFLPRAEIALREYTGN